MRLVGLLCIFSRGIAHYNTPDTLPAATVAAATAVAVAAAAVPVFVVAVAAGARGICHSRGSPSSAH